MNHRIGARSSSAGSPWRARRRFAFAEFLTSTRAPAARPAPPPAQRRGSCSATLRAPRFVEPGHRSRCHSAPRRPPASLSPSSAAPRKLAERPRRQSSMITSPARQARTQRQYPGGADAATVTRKRRPWRTSRSGGFEPRSAPGRVVPPGAPSLPTFRRRPARSDRRRRSLAERSTLASQYVAQLEQQGWLAVSSDGRRRRVRVADETRRSAIETLRAMADELGPMAPLRAASGR